MPVTASPVLSPPSFLMPSCQIIGRPVTGECPESHGVCSLPISPEVPSGQNGSDVWNPAFLHCFRLSCKRTVSPAFHQRPHCRRSAKGKTEAPCVTSEVSSRLAKAGGTDTLVSAPAGLGAGGRRPGIWCSPRERVHAPSQPPEARAQADACVRRAAFRGEEGKHRTAMKTGLGRQGAAETPVYPCGPSSRRTDLPVRPPGGQVLTLKGPFGKIQKNGKQ